MPSSTAPPPVTNDIANFLRSKTDSPATKKRKLEVELLNAEAKQREAEAKKLEASNQAKNANAMVTMAEAVKDMMGAMNAQNGKK